MSICFKNKSGFKEGATWRPISLIFTISERRIKQKGNFKQVKITFKTLLKCHRLHLRAYHVKHCPWALRRAPDPALERCFYIQGKDVAHGNIRR